VAQGRLDAAIAAIRRAIGVATDSAQRMRLLPAVVEIMLAAGEIQEAREACRELREIAGSFDASVMDAIVAHARGSLELAEGDARAAIVSARCAWQAWQRIGAPYMAARARMLMGLACRALGDSEGGELELAAARGLFKQLEARPDLARIDALTKEAAPGPAHGLTPRELQVLRRVAAGKTNKAVAAELFLSEKTIERHVSNIFTKLNVDSRSAATAYAHQNKLI
jgi:DNA-binding CsgD family transcriptional regulator